MNQLSYETAIKDIYAKYDDQPEVLKDVKQAVAHALNCVLEHIETYHKRRTNLGTSEG